jgi:hypothetical protein
VFINKFARSVGALPIYHNIEQPPPFLYYRRHHHRRRPPRVPLPLAPPAHDAHPRPPLCRCDRRVWHPRADGSRHRGGAGALAADGGGCVRCVCWLVCVCVCGRVVRAEKQHGLVYSRRVSCLTKSPTAKFFLFLSLSHLITYICTPPYIYTYTCIKHTPVLAPRESYEIEFRERSVREWCSKVDCLCLYIDIDGWPALLFFTTGAQRRDRSFAYTYTIQHRHARVGSWGYGWTRSPCPCASSG